MHSLLNTFSSNLFVDRTYVIHKENIPCITSRVSVAMIVKDFKEDSAIQNAFPDATIFYFFWHNENTLKKRFATENFNSVKQMMLADTEAEIYSKLEVFKILEKDNETNLN